MLKKEIQHNKELSLKPYKELSLKPYSTTEIKISATFFTEQIDAIFSDKNKPENKLEEKYKSNLLVRENNDSYIKIENYIKWWDILNINIEDLNKINNNLLKILFYSELKKRYPKNEVEEELISELNWDLLFLSFINRYNKRISIKNEKLANWLYFEKWDEKFWNIIFDSSSFDDEQFWLEFINLLWLFDLEYTLETNWNKKYKLSEEKYNIFKNYFSTIRKINSLEDISNFTLKDQNKYLWNIDKIHEYLDPDDILKFIINSGITLDKWSNTKEKIKNTIIEYESITPANLNKCVENNKINIILDKIMPLYEANYTDSIFLEYIRKWLTKMIEDKDFKKFHFLSIWKSNISWFFEQKKYDNKTNSYYFYLWGLNSKTNLWLGFPLFKERVNTLWNRYDLVLEVALTVWDENNKDAEFLIKKYKSLWFEVVWKYWDRKDENNKLAYEYAEMKRKKTAYYWSKTLFEWWYSRGVIEKSLEDYKYLLEDWFIDNARSLDITEWLEEIEDNIIIIKRILKSMSWNDENFKYDYNKTILENNLYYLNEILEEYNELIRIWYASITYDETILYPESDNKDEYTWIDYLERYSVDNSRVYHH